MNDEDVTGRIAEHFSELRKKCCAAIPSSEHNQVRMDLMCRSKDVFVRRAFRHVNVDQSWKPGLDEDTSPNLLGHLREDCHLLGGRVGEPRHQMQGSYLGLMRDSESDRIAQRRV